jgi:hypothetical protein
VESTRADFPVSSKADSVEAEPLAVTPHAAAGEGVETAELEGQPVALIGGMMFAQ